MIIYYKLPSYPTAMATLPFAKISAMRRKHLAKYYNNCVGGKTFSNDVRPGKLDSSEKSSENYGQIHESLEQALQRNSDIQKLMKEVTGHYGALGRRVHSSGKRRQWFLNEEKRDFVVNTDDAKKFSEVNSGVEKVSANVKMVRCPVYISSVKLRNLGERRVNMEATKEKIKYVIDEVTSVNMHFRSKVAHQKQIKQTHQRQTPEKRMNNDPTFSPSKRNEQSPMELNRSPRQFRRSPTRTPKRTCTVSDSKATSVSGCSAWSPDVFNTVLITLPRKDILNIPSAKRQALMGYNLPVINEQNYLSCPAISKCKVSSRCSSPENITLPPSK